MGGCDVEKESRQDKFQHVIGAAEPASEAAIGDLPALAALFASRSPCESESPQLDAAQHLPERALLASIHDSSAVGLAKKKQIYKLIDPYGNSTS